MIYGFAYWRFLHFFALHNIGRDLIKQLPQFMPEEWRLEWEEPADDADLVVWSKDLHNKVNAKLGRYANWDMTDFNISHQNTCECCIQGGNCSIYGFPWFFIHGVAEVGGDMALPFLQAFNNIFPCPHCQGEFFTDVPMEGESVLAWTVRHHNRINLSIGLPEITWSASVAQPEETPEESNAL